MKDRHEVGKNQSHVLLPSREFVVIDRFFWPMSDEHTDETEINPEEVPK
jgi:hypothetical protein